MRITWAPFGAFLPLAGALSWAHTSFWKGDTAQGPKELADSHSPDEIASILKGSGEQTSGSMQTCHRPSEDALEKYSAKPGCFRRAAAMLRASCAELETREDERVKAALAMTLCEIATAEHHSFPMECAPFQSGFQASYYDGHASPSRCVQALSRSAQYWSSYSGYLREVPQLCFAFTRWNDIDVAKELHRNTTVQSLTILQYLAGREKLSEHILLQSGALVKDMRVVLDELHISSTSINALPSGIMEELRQVLSKMSNDYQSSTVAMQQHYLQEHALEKHRMEARLGNIVADLAMATSTLGPMLEGLLSDSIEAVLTSVTPTLHRLNELAGQAALHFGDLERDVVLLQHDVGTLTGDIHTARVALEEGLRSSLIAQEKQLETARAAEDITTVLGDLIDMAHLEVQSINETAIAVKRSLLNDGSAGWSGVTWSWFEAASLFFLRSIWKGT
ncbi:hypothetical protein C8Q73DRAFT_437795 [Cubamyces lactineus]|nr:hypothetical protein C8Q73DRAFT_437795 [Cubamyces lactineus]